MNWIQVTIETTSQGIEPVSGRLYQLGVTGLEIEDANDFNDFLENSRPYWDYVDDSLMTRATAPTVIRAYLTDNASGHEMLMSIRQTLDALKALDSDAAFGSLRVSLTNMQEKDWAENWKQYYKPIKIGKKILIRPEWESVDNTEGRIVFQINPGMSFGTGTHESTQLCIEQLETLVKPGMHVLDLGCGSGILSILAVMLGADYAFAIDIDPNAVKIAQENAKKNHLTAQQYEAMAGDILTDADVQAACRKERYDIVVANIVADVIIALSAQIRPLLKPNGIFLCSGIIEGRYDDVKAALQQAGFTLIHTEKKREWLALTVK